MSFSFVHALSSTDQEYYTIQEAWAREGYTVLSYETRGWDGVGGAIGTAGPADVKDHKAVVDYLVAHASTYSVDIARFGNAGVSYGAGIASITAALDPRIKAVASLSGWGNLTSALYGAETVSSFWGDVLVESGGALGKEPQELLAQWKHLNEHTNVAGVRAWADNRSVLMYIDQLCGNGRSTPVFVSSNVEDRLFKPDYAADYRDALVGSGCETKLLFNQGIHASAEILDLVGITTNSTVWYDTLQWFESHLKKKKKKKKENNKEAVNGAVTIDVRKHGLLQAAKRLTFPSALTANKDWMDSTILRRYSLGAAASGPGAIIPGAGVLLPQSDAARLSEKLKLNDESVRSIHFTNTSGLTAGVPIVSEILQVFVDVPIITDLASLDSKVAALWVLDSLSPLDGADAAGGAEGHTVCGTPSLSLQIKARSSSPNVQIFAYLYDILIPNTAMGIAKTKVEGTLLTHGPRTVWGGVGTFSGVWRTVPLRFRSMCWVVEKGHTIALGIALAEASMYGTANAASDLEVDVRLNESKLVLPVL